MIISKPCNHPDCPERDGFIRGRYESIEFIREIPSKVKKSSSTTDLTNFRRPSLIDTTGRMDTTESAAGHRRQLSSGSFSGEGRLRGKTISFAESRGAKAKGENLDRQQESEEELNPVEWIMITRSDPGGSVPRFMVERGTPSGIVNDAKKFLDWACKISNPIKKPEEVHEETVEAEEPPTERHKTAAEVGALQTNGHLVGLNDPSEFPEAPPAMSSYQQLPNDSLKSSQQAGLLASAANIAYSTIGAYTPQAIKDRFPTFTPSSSALTGSTEVDTIPPATPEPPRSPSPTPSSSESSIGSFASADSHLTSPAPSINSRETTAPSTSSKATNSSPHDKELAKLAARKQKLDAKVAKLKEKENKNKEELTTKEQERLKKAEEKHAREIAKAEEKHAKELASLENKRKKEQAKQEERRKKAQDKDEKARLIREKDELKAELEMVKSERDILAAQVGELQKQNTALAVRIGKLEGSPPIATGLRELEAGGNAVGTRSRSGSLRRAVTGLVVPPLASAGLDGKMGTIRKDEN